jgi:hypothetical protein
MTLIFQTRHARIAQSIYVYLMHLVASYRGFERKPEQPGTPKKKKR